MKHTFGILTVITLALTLMACSISVNLFEPTPTPTESLPMIEPTAAFAVAAPTVEIILPTAVSEEIITVYFMDENRFVAAVEPYEVAVTRTVPAGSDLPRAVLDAYFAGPTLMEYTQGLRLVSSGFTHVRRLEIENGIARVYLGGVCANNGAAYSVANLIMKNLSQFPEIQYVKIYDENDSNLDPDSMSSSLPYCLEP
ncbi:MAG: GerMN domain-containing protein [Anaerolineaceae bacterium]|nr:GerMN domain-containing protein [Anaerolineaceae bacterium]